MTLHQLNKLNTQPILVAIADDHSLIRQSVVHQLEEKGDIKVICAVPDGQSLISFLNADTTLPKVCILDIQMHDMDGMQTLTHIKQHWPEIKVIMLTGFVTERNVMLAGNKKVNGLLSKQDPPNELRDAVIHLNTHPRYFNQHLTRDQFDRATDLNAAVPSFTKQELKLIKFSGADMVYKEIAELMNMTEKAVSSAFNRLFTKTNTKGKSALFRYALMHGLIVL